MPEHGAAVALGGALGSVGRVGLGVALPSDVVAMVVVNVTGALLLAVLLARTDDDRLRHLLGTGVLGAWTTFSALAVAADPVVAGGVLPATFVGIGSLGAGVLAAAAGTRVAT